MIRSSLAPLLLILAAAGAAEAGPMKVTGRVVFADGKPAAGVDVCRNWDHAPGRMNPFEPLKTDLDGRFTYAIDTRGHMLTLLAADADRKLGGVVVIDPTKGDQAVEIKLAPLSRVRGEFTSSDPAHPVEMSGVYVLSGDDGMHFSQSFSFDMSGKEPPKGPARFELRLPPGEYNLQCYVPNEIPSHQGTARLVTIKPEQAGQDRDLGKIELTVNPLVKLAGQEPPPLKIKDARGVPKGVKLADFKGKYVLLEFWATTCGPCVARGLPALVELYDEHEADRDKFVILAVHGQGADDLADMDKKLIPIVRDTWLGRPLPFPILLDDDGRTFAAYGIEAIPASVLIGPDGKVVPGGVEALAEALPRVEVPPARKVARAFDRQVSFGVGPKGATLGEMLEALASQADVEIKPDLAALEKAGIKLDANLPLTIAGQVSLRSWLDLVLDPFGLVAAPGPECLVVTTRDPADAGKELPSTPQRICADRIARKLEEKTSYDSSGATLAELVEHFEGETCESFVIDPKDRLLGRLDPGLKVSGKAENVAIRDALKTLLGPIGVEAVVRDEVVVLTRIRP